MVFDDYKGRVEKCIEQRKRLGHLKDMQSLVKAFQEKEDPVLAQLNGELDKIKAKVSDPQLF